MDIPEVKSCESEIEEPIQDVDGVDFLDISDLVPDTSDSEVEKLAKRLANQLIQFHRYYSDCHEHTNREHTSQHEMHYGLATFVAQTKDEVLSGCPDVLGSTQVAHHDDDLAGSIITAQKRWVFSGVYIDDSKETPVHICLQQEEKPCKTAEVIFDIDSITGFCPSLGIANGGIRWNIT